MSGRGKQKAAAAALTASSQRLVAAARAQSDAQAKLVRTVLRELVAAAHSGDADNALLALEALVPSAQDEDATVRNELAALGGAAVVLSALTAFGRTRPRVLVAGCVLLCSLTLADPAPQDLESASVAAIRIALQAPPAADTAGRDLQLLGLTHVLLSAQANRTDAALRAEVLAAGAVEALVAAAQQVMSVQSFHVLLALCVPVGAPSDACAQRVVTVGGVDAALALLAQIRWGADDTPVEREWTLALFAAQLLTLMHSVVRTIVAPEEALLSAFRGREAEIFRHLLVGLAGPARADKGWVVAAMGTLAVFAISPEGERCAPELAAAATDGIVDLLRFLQL